MKFRLLKANEIDVRVATCSEKGCSLLLYKDARVDQNILDETVGSMNWQRSHQLIGQSLYCTVSIYDAEKGIWISKQDVGTKSYTEEEKGLASDSFKRACFNWGIGRELYTAPFIWVPANLVNIEPKNGKNTTYDNFAVKSIGYTSMGEINKLQIINTKRKQVVYTLGKDIEEPEALSKKELTVLIKLVEKKGLDINATFPNGVENLTPEQYAEAIRKLESLKDKA